MTKSFYLIQAVENAIFTAVTLVNQINTAYNLSKQQKYK